MGNACSDPTDGSSTLSLAAAPPLISGAGAEETLVVLFYKYVRIDSVSEVVSWLLDRAARLDMLGRILIAEEGINGTLSGAAPAVRDFIRAVSAHALFGGVDWKTSGHPAGARLPFPDLVIKQVKQIVHLGCEADPGAGGQHLSPAEFHQAVQAGLQNEREVVLIDVRNSYEHAIGRFDGSIEPAMKEFSAFPAFVDAHAEEWKGKQVLMYCTGGIRCEKASAYVRSCGVEKVGQLAGGIHRYLEEYTDGGHFKGKNFVFDQRVAIGSTDTTVVGRCLCCEAPYDQLAATRVCTVCRDLVLVCPACQALLVEFHCAKHQIWRSCYYSFLDRFDEAELAGQQTELQRHWDELGRAAGGGRAKGGGKGGSKKLKCRNKRVTLRKQIEKIDAELQSRVAAGPAAAAAAVAAAVGGAASGGRRCRTCGKAAAECEGRCSGYGLREDKRTASPQQLAAAALAVPATGGEVGYTLGHHGRSKVFRHQPAAAVAATS